MYTPVKNLSLSFSYSEGVRIPTVDEIFAQGPFGSNLDLKAMKSRNFEVGRESQLQDWLDASLALFYTPVRDEILFIATDPLDLVFRTQRKHQQDFAPGHRSSPSKLDLSSGWTAFINYSVMKATFETDFFIPGINFSMRRDWSKKATSCPPCHAIGSASASTFARLMA